MMNAAPYDLLAYFCGRWTFTRVMLGAAAECIGTADGDAEFTPAPPAAVLHYRESGHLSLAAARRVVSFSRRFDYLLQDDVVQVRFADGAQAGQPYQRYRFDPSRQALLPVAVHACGNDRYDARYQLIDMHHFDLHTRITGPHKDYALHTQFSRVAAVPGDS